MLVYFHIENEILNDCLTYQDALSHFIFISAENVSWHNYTLYSGTGMFSSMSEIAGNIVLNSNQHSLNDSL